MNISTVANNSCQKFVNNLSNHSDKSSKYSKVTPLAQNISGENETGKMRWDERLIKRVEKSEVELDRILPNFNFQNRYDQLMAEIEREFNSPNNSWNQFNAWLEDNGHGNWNSQLGIFLAKLPLKAARNILRLFIKVLKTAMQAPLWVLMHPLKAPLELAKLLVVLVQNLIQPETWTKMGLGVIGTSLANATCSYNPIGVFGIGIGAALTISGISVGTLKTALYAKKDVRWNTTKSYLVEQAKSISEDLLTGYCLGLLIHGTQKIIRECQKAHHNAKYEHNVQVVKDQNNQLIRDVNAKNAHAIDEINRKNADILKNSKNAYIDQKSSEFFDKYKFPSADKYSKNDQGFSVRWPIEKAYGSNLPMTDIPEGKFVVESLQTGVSETHTNVWIDGFYTPEMRLVQTDHWINIDNQLQYIPAKYEYVQQWHHGHWADSVTTTPIYEKFVGYNVAVKGWTPPSLLKMPTPLPAPTLKPLPVKPPLPKAIKVGDANIQLMGIAPAINYSRTDIE